MTCCPVYPSDCWVGFQNALIVLLSWLVQSPGGNHQLGPKGTCPEVSGQTTCVLPCIDFEPPFLNTFRDLLWWGSQWFDHIWIAKPCYASRMPTGSDTNLLTHARYRRYPLKLASLANCSHKITVETWWIPFRTIEGYGFCTVTFQLGRQVQAERIGDHSTWNVWGVSELAAWLSSSNRIILAAMRHPHQPCAALALLRWLHYVSWLHQV